MKRINLIMLFFPLLLGASGCTSQIVDINININNVRKINVFSGSIRKFVGIINREQIEYITNNFNNLNLKKNNEQAENEFLYSIAWYGDNENIIDDVTIISSNKLIYDNIVYTISNFNKEIDIQYIDNVFKEASNHDSEFIEAGLYYGNNNSEPTPPLATAIKAKKTQETIANLTVYAGYIKGFIDKRNNNVWGSNPGYGKFILERVIMDNKNNEISNHIFQLNDFENEEKYSVRPVCIKEGTDAVYFRDFSFYFEDKFNFDEISTDQGNIFYRINLIDENNQIIGDRLNCGQSIVGLYFKKTNNQITFSLYDIFNE